MSTVILRHAPQAFPDLAITPLNPTFAALVENIDLAREHSDHTVAMIRDALVEHKLLVFRGQRITPTQQRDFAARFGALHVHPLLNHDDELKEIIVLNYDRERPPEPDEWHTDVTFIETPPLGSVLLARELPPHGGDTLWSNMAAAFAALSTPLQALLTGLSAVHDFAKSFPAEEYAAKVGEDGWQRARAKNPPVVHPVVRTHPATGVKGLFVNEGFTTGILGLTARESDALLRFLFEHIARPEFTC
ncbi:MAG TPA: TauD/TfdA family dioxygenase, partial [Dongiaceae bacterium]